MKTEFRRHHPLTPWTYARLDARQREIANQVRAGGDGVLLLSELAPVITYGRRTDLARDLILDAAQFASAELELYPSDRGGFATYHGPGQWVAFPVESLKRLTGDPRGVRLAVEGLCEAALGVARKYRSDAEVKVGAELGVWSEAAGGKLASVGVHIQAGVLLHGVALNVYRQGPSFLGIRPCGLDASPAYLVPGEPGEGGFFEVGQQLEATVRSHFRL